MQIVIDIPEQMYLNAKANTLCGGDIIVKAIKNGTPLPDGAEILTKEAYSDLCTRAANVPDTNAVDFKQAVLDVITHELMCGAVVDQCGLETAYDLIKELPPEKRTEERTETHACDCISRQAAIDALSHMMDTDGFRDGWAVSRANVDCMLRYLPSVEPERKTGKWIIKIEDWNRWTCSECGFSTRTDIHVTLGYDYCPKCGAPMEVDG